MNKSRSRQNIVVKKKHIEDRKRIRSYKFTDNYRNKHLSNHRKHGYELADESKSNPQVNL